MAGVKGQRSGGHNRKTTRQHKLEGTFQKSRHAGVRNPEPPRGTPVAPKKLEGDARLEWRRMIGRLSSSKTLSVVDDAALYQYCQLFAETEAIATSQRDVKALMKILKQNLRDLEGAALVAAVQEIAKLQQLEARHATQRRQSRMAVRIYLVEFGLTPASRARVKIHDPAEHEPYNQPPETDAMVEFDTPPGLKLVKGRGGKRT